MHDLQEAADDDEVLEKVDHLVLVSEVVMEERGSRDNKSSENQCYRADSITEKQ